MIRVEGVEIRWHEIGHACKMYGFAYGAAFLALAILNSSPEFKHVAQTSPWIPRYVGDGLAFVVTMLIIWRASHGSLGSFGFALGTRNLHLRLSVAMGATLALVWILLDYSLLMLASTNEAQITYPRTVTNLVGMLAFQWVFVGVFEEPLARGLVQTYLMNQLRGVVKVSRWNFHVGTIIAGVLFGVGHVVPHVFFGQPWLSIGSHVVLATLFGLLAGYVYQETRSLAGPIVMHNIVDGLLYTVALAY
jgi:membrane protease YdiL (CAAX protease family)